MRDPVAFASLVLKQDKSSVSLPFTGSGHLCRLFCSSKRNQKKSRFTPLTFVLIGDRSPSILAESSCQLLSSPSYSLCVQSLSIPHAKSPDGRRPSLPSPSQRRLCPATLSNLNPQCLKSAVPREACSSPCPLLSFSFSLSRARSPPSLSSLSFHNLPRALCVPCSFDK